VVADVSFLFILLCARGEITPGVGWLFRAVGLAGSVRFVFRPSSSGPAVADFAVLFQVCLVVGRCVFNVQVFVYWRVVGNDSCGSSNVWRHGATGKTDLWRLWRPAAAGGSSGVGCALERWKDFCMFSLVPGCLLAKGWRCICNLTVPSF
jgi:hypothetical protein